MSVLDFIASILNRLTTAFQSYWYNLLSLITTMYGSVQYYWQRLQYFLMTFADRYVFSTDWYHHHARNPLDYIGVFNFATTVYNAITSHPQQAEYNTQLRNPLADFAYNLRGRVVHVVVTLFDAINNLASKPRYIIDYITGAGALVTQVYEQWERTPLRFFISRQPTIDKVSEPTFVGKLAHLGETLFHPISTVFGPYYQDLTGLIQSAQKVAIITHQNIFPKIQETFTTKYTGLAGLLDVAANVIDLMTPTKKTKLDYLLDRGLDFLVPVVEEPPKTILDLVKDIFFEWFLWRLFMWLTEEID